MTNLAQQLSPLSLTTTTDLGVLLVVTTCERLPPKVVVERLAALDDTDPALPKWEVFTLDGVSLPEKTVLEDLDPALPKWEVLPLPKWDLVAKGLRPTTGTDILTPDV